MQTFLQSRPVPFLSPTLIGKRFWIWRPKAHGQKKREIDLGLFSTKTKRRGYKPA